MRVEKSKASEIRIKSIKEMRSDMMFKSLFKWKINQVEIRGQLGNATASSAAEALSKIDALLVKYHP